MADLVERADQLNARLHCDHFALEGNTIRRGAPPLQLARSRIQGCPLEPLRELRVHTRPLGIPAREPEQANVFPKQRGLDSLDVARFDVADTILRGAKPVGNIPNIQSCQFS